MFCDSYNPQQKTYCKRLKVLCPEHSKEPKASIKIVESNIDKEVHSDGSENTTKR